MKILFVTHYPHMMGANRSLLTLLKGLKVRGVEVSVLTPAEGELTTILTAENIPFLVAPFKRWANRIFSTGYFLAPFAAIQNRKVATQLAERIQSDPPDLIYTNSSMTGVGVQLAQKLQKPHIQHIREFGWADYQFCYYPSLNKFRWWLGKSDAVVVISEAIRKAHTDGIEVPIFQVYNGVPDSTKLIAASKTSDTFTFLIIGMLHPNKGQMQALKAFYLLQKKYPDTELVIAGNGRRIYTRKMKWFVWRKQLQNKVRFTGYVSNPQSLYEEADAVLMCSKSEGMGRVTVEAMAYGKPVVGYSGGATPELVKHRENGLIYEGDERDLARQMAYLILHPNEAQEMGGRGREMALSTFTTDKYVEEIWQVIAQNFRSRPHP